MEGVLPSLESWQHLEGRAFPPPFFCSCEMLISVSFSWFMCLGGWSGRECEFGERGAQLRTSRELFHLKFLGETDVLRLGKSCVLGRS